MATLSRMSLCSAYACSPNIQIRIRQKLTNVKKVKIRV
jgi:hypothetical protein